MNIAVEMVSVNDKLPQVGKDILFATQEGELHLGRKGEVFYEYFFMDWRGSRWINVDDVVAWVYVNFDIDYYNLALSDD